mgnify:CR=1 FL=1
MSERLEGKKMELQQQVKEFEKPQQIVLKIRGHN